MGDKTTLIDMTAEIVSAYVGNNKVEASQIPEIIRHTFDALDTVARNGVASDEPRQQPAVSIRHSVTDDYIVCLEDGQKFKSLKRHLRTHYNLSPEEYREKWGLPKDYPMVAPNYAKARSKLAKQMGLGQSRTNAKRKRK